MTIEEFIIVADELIVKIDEQLANGGLNMRILDPLINKCGEFRDFITFIDRIEDYYQSNERREVIDDFKKFDEQTKNGLRKTLILVTKISPLRESTPVFLDFLQSEYSIDL